jgi:hypothetical protein
LVHQRRGMEPKLLEGFCTEERWADWSAQLDLLDAQGSAA